jgi:hypothetical protein
MLIMFRVTSANLHMVCPVALGATGRRLTINGFWHRSARGAPPDRVPGTAVVSPRAYGPSPPASGSPILVL